MTTTLDDFDLDAAAKVLMGQFAEQVQRGKPVEKRLGDLVLPIRPWPTPDPAKCSPEDTWPTPDPAKCSPEDRIGVVYPGFGDLPILLEPHSDGWASPSFNVPLVGAVGEGSGWLWASKPTALDWAERQGNHRWRSDAKRFWLGYRLTFWTAPNITITAPSPGSEADRSLSKGLLRFKYHLYLDGFVEGKWTPMFGANEFFGTLDEAKERGEAVAREWRTKRETAKGGAR